MYINNQLRDTVYRNNLLHGFWDNARTYGEFVHNILGELDEAMAEFDSGHGPKEVYYKKGNKPEGVPTELADVIIFILDYFGGSEPPIDIDEDFLQKPADYYKNNGYYEQIRSSEAPSHYYFMHTRQQCRDHISLSWADYQMHGNESFVADNGETVGVKEELHEVIRQILAYCDIFEINMEKELIDKINYNNSRPKDYRKMGQAELLETDPQKIEQGLLRHGLGWYKLAGDFAKENAARNDIVLGKRSARKEAESGDTQR